MRAMQLLTPDDVHSRPLRFVECEIPIPGTGEILVRVDFCGVCHTDLHIVEGELLAPSYPRIPGHQIVGQVISCGEGVQSAKVGERVGIPWVYKTCGSCKACQRGEENLCDKPFFTGFHVDGGFAEYFIAADRFVLHLPEGMSNSLAAPLLCAGIIGYRSLKCADLKPGETLGLVGFGASAHLAIQVAHFMGCKVWVFTRTQGHRQNARELGAHWVGGIEDDIPESLDRMVLFAPTGALVPLCLEKIRPGGSLAINAIYMSDLPPFPYRVLYGEKTLRSVTNATRQDGLEFLDIVLRADIRPNVQIYPLIEANRALMDLKESKVIGEAVLEIDG